jgi:hypothetical protein
MLIDEHDWGTNASEQAFNVSINGTTVTRLDWPSNPFTAIRLKGIQNCQTHCEGSVIVGTDCGKGDCAAYGANCVDDALGVRCSSVFCPTIGHQTICVDQTKTMECQDGIPLGTGDCAPFAAICTMTLGADAVCVSDFCVSDPKQAPVVHDVCLPNGAIGHCGADGLPTQETCATDESCTVTASGVSCAAPSPPGTATADGGPTLAPPIQKGSTPTHGGSASQGGVTPSDEGGCSVTPAREPRAPLGFVGLALIGLMLRLRLRSARQIGLTFSARGPFGP